MKKIITRKIGAALVAAAFLLWPLSAIADSPAPTPATQKQAADPALGRAAGGTVNLLINSPLPDLNDLMQRVQATEDESAAALKSGDLDVFALVSHMASDYQEVNEGAGAGLSRDDVLRRERTLLAKNRFTAIETGVTSLILTGPDAATVTLWRRTVYISTGTPATYVKTPQGIIVVNNTSRTTRLQFLEQTWRRDKQAGWMVSRSRVVQDMAVAVL